MNERIRLLAEHAGITTNLDTDYFERDMTKWVNYYSEKFTELIVKECVAICQDTDGEDNIDARSGRQDCAVEIKEHFGVEE